MIGFPCALAKAENDYVLVEMMRLLLTETTGKLRHSAPADINAFCGSRGRSAQSQPCALKNSARRAALSYADRGRCSFSNVFRRRVAQQCFQIERTREHRELPSRGARPFLPRLVAI